MSQSAEEVDQLIEKKREKLEELNNLLMKFTADITKWLKR